MTLRPLNNAVMSFIFFNSFIGGLVAIGIGSSFSLMLSERGVDVSIITNILLATLPYSWKFIISPFVKNLILKYNAVKSISYISQFLVFIGFSSLGFFEKSGSLLLVSMIILLTVIFVSVHDIIRAHIKLVLFDAKDFGLVSAVENTGFRLGMFVSGACIVYIANAISWSAAFMTVGLCVFFATASTAHMKIGKQRISTQQNTIVSNPLKNYLSDCFTFLKKYNLQILAFVILSFKMTDSCINVLKPMFMRHIGVSRIAFANISHLFGTISITISGIIAGIAISKIGITKCVKLTFLAQMLVSLMFVYLATFKVDIVTVAVCVNFAIFFFGFLNVVFRTFAAQEAKRDVNMYTSLLSIGSLVRIVLYTFAGTIVDYYSWQAVYLFCFFSNIPGYFLYSKLRKR